MKQVICKKSLYITYSAIIIAILSLVLINSTYADESLNLNYSVTVEPALNITTSSNKVSLDLNPLNHDFDSQDLTVSVSTNNETGYKLYVNTDSTKLIEKDDNSLYIETLSGEVPDDADGFTSNRWGYKLNSSATKFSSFNPGTLILSSKTIADGKNTDDITTMVFAAKVGYETKAGTYALALNFQVTANPHYKTIAEAEYLQEVSSKEAGGCPADLSSTQTYTLKDSRDGQEYKVARLKDGNCWMVTNLNLGAIDLMEDLTSENTNTNITIGASTFNNQKVTRSSFTYTSGEHMPSPGTDPVSLIPYGMLYNYCTASGYTYCYDKNSRVEDTLSYDICPAGWRLPTAESGGEFQMLYENWYNSYSLMRSSVANGGAAFALSGVWTTEANQATVSSVGSYARYWSSTLTTYNYSYASDLILGTDSVMPLQASYRCNGASIRCILK